MDKLSALRRQAYAISSIIYDFTEVEHDLFSHYGELNVPSKMKIIRLMMEEIEKANGSEK